MDKHKDGTFGWCKDEEHELMSAIADKQKAMEDFIEGVSDPSLHVQPLLLYLEALVEADHRILTNAHGGVAGSSAPISGDATKGELTIMGKAWFLGAMERTQRIIDYLRGEGS